MQEVQEREHRLRCWLWRGVVGGGALALFLATMAIEEDISKWLREVQARGSKYITLAVKRHPATAPLAVEIVGLSGGERVFEERYELAQGHLFEYQVVAPRERTRFERRIRRLFANDFWIFFEQLGLVWWGIMGCMFLWAYDAPRRRYIIVFVLASIVSGAMVDVIKNTVGKIRPDPFFDGDLPARFMGLCAGWKQKLPVSFPSGHTTQAFVTAAFFARLYPRARVMLYLAVVFTALSRVVTGAHWLSDIYGGALLGYATTQVSFWLWERWGSGALEKLPPGMRDWLRRWGLC